MNRFLKPRFLLILGIPLLAKLLGALGFALGFVFGPKWLAFVGVFSAAVLTTITIIITVRFLLGRRWFEAFLLVGAASLSIFAPSVFSVSIYLNPGYWKFRMQKDAYVSAIRTDLSPSPKFQFFLLDEDPDFPGGGVWYYVIYDETREIGLPPQSRSATWNVKHSGFSSQDSLNARSEVIPLEDDFFLFVRVL